MRRATANQNLAARLGLLVLIGFAFRLAVYLGRLANDPVIHRMTAPSDMAIYIEQARSLLDGSWPGSAFFYQPGNSFWLGLLLWVGRDNLYTAVVMTFTLASLSILPLVYAGYVFSGRSMRTGLLAGFLYAVYPVSAFFDTTLLIEPPVTFFGILALASGAWLIERQQWYQAALTGLLIGICCFFRTTMIALLPAVLLGLAFTRARPPRKALLAGLVGVSIALALAPAAWWNTTQAGRFTITSTSGPLNLYRGNNRDAAGINTNTQAYYIEHSRGQDWSEAFIADVRAEPGRWLGLYVRKFSLLWANPELADMFDYYSTGLGSAPVLHISPLGFGLLILLALGGLGMGLARPYLVWTPGLFVIGYTALMALVYAVGRYRIAVVPAMCIAAAFGLVQLIERRVSLPKGAAAYAAAGVLLIGLNWAGTALPRPRFLPSSELPAGYVPTDLEFGEGLHLIGYRLEEGGAYADDWLRVSLIWRSDVPQPVDYSVFLSLLEDDGHRIGQKDLTIGTVSHPWTPLTRWRPGAVFREEVAVRASNARSLPASPTLWIGVYDKATMQRLPIDDGAGSSFSNRGAALGEVRLVASTPAEVPAPQQSVRAVFGEGVALEGYTLMPAQPQPGQAVEIGLLWSVEAPLPYDASLFVHLVNGQGEIVAQHDAPPLNGALPTSLWRAGDRWWDAHSLSLPPDLPEGQYTLRIGLYYWLTGQRTPIQGATLPTQDSALDLATLTLN